MKPVLTSTKYARNLNSTAYSHEETVLKQFEACLELPPSKLLERIGIQGSRSDKIKEESLVMLARELHRRGREALAWKVVVTICERVQPSIARSIALWRLSPVQADELTESLVAALYEAILDHADVEKFWEIRFWVCFDRRLLSSLRRHRILEDRTTPAEHLLLQPGCSVTAFAAESDWRDPALRAMVAEGLAQLPDPLRTAFMLKHWAGFAEHSADPSVRATITSVLGVSDRTVRNYLNRAERLLNEWRHGSEHSSVQIGEGK